MSEGFISLNACPWTSEHTGDDPSGAAYAPPFTVNGDDGNLIPIPLFKCHHGHCSDKTTQDFIGYAVSNGYTPEEDIIPSTPSEVLKPMAQAVVDLAKDDVGICFESKSLVIFRFLLKKAPAEWQRIRKELKKIKGVSITDLMKAIQSERLTEEDTGREIDEHDIALKVIDVVKPENLLFSNSIFWIWKDKGVWGGVDDRILQKYVHIVISDYFKDIPISRARVQGVLDLLKTECYIDGHEFNTDKTRINCLNGELNFIGGKWVLEPHERSHYRTNQIPVIYDLEAEAPKFEQFMEDIFKGDGQPEHKAWLIMQCIGYTLLSSTQFEKFIMLIGSGANGKSVLLAVIEALMGRENVAAVQPYQFHNIFQRAHLQDKIANIVSELKVGAAIDDDVLKSIVSGESSTVEQKYKPPFEFQPFCTCWFGTNHLPHTKDFSNGLFRRAIVVPFNRTFSEAEQNRSLKQELIEELPGILNIALDALTDLLTENQFIEVDEVDKAKDSWRTEADQVAQFVEDYCDLTGVITSAELYRAYKEWAEKNGVQRMISQHTLTIRVQRFDVERGKVEGERGLIGIDLKI